MFFVANNQNDKKKKIINYLHREPMISVLLAAANFEWTIGRCILLFGKTANVELRNRLVSCSGLDRYKKIWKEELINNDPSIPPLAQIIKNWKEFREAFELRHRLIHGRGTCTRNMALEPVQVMLDAVDNLYGFALSRGKNLHHRLPVRRKKKAT
jgi:hypothetical protein